MSNTYDFPIRKDYELNIKIELTFGEKIDYINKKLVYSQASILETITDFEKMNEGMDVVFLNFLKENGFEESEVILLGLQAKTLENLLITFLTTRYKGVLNKEDILNPKEELQNQRGMPYHALLVLVAEKLNIDPLTFQERYTFEQMVYLMNGIEYMLNLKTDEGVQKNKEKYEKTENYDSMLLNKLKLVG